MIEYYKQAFLNSDTTIFWGDAYISRNWDDATMYLYFGIVLVTMLVSSILNNRVFYANNLHQININNNLLYKKYRFYLVFLFGVFLLILGGRHYTVGVDTPQYLNNVNNVEYLDGSFLSFQFEPLFRIILYGLHFLLPDGRWGIFLLSFATLFFIFGAIKKYFGKIDLYVCLLTYVCIYFFPSMNLMRMVLASSFILFNVQYLVNGNYKKFAFIIFVAFLIHFSSIIVFLPFGMYLLYKRSKFFAFAILIVFLSLIISSSFFLGDYVAWITRYSEYFENQQSTGKVGIMAFVDYLPSLYVSYYILKEKKNGVWADLTVCFTGSAVVVRAMAYYILAAGRLHFHFMMLTLLFVPYWLHQFRGNNTKQYPFLVLFVTLWALLRLHLYFTSYLAADGIMPFHFAWF